MTGYLIDTHVFIWLMAARERLSPAVVATVTDPANAVYLSVASAIELFDKFSKGGGTGLDHVLKQGAKALAADLDEAGVALLGVELRHAAAMRDLPLHHRDPVDRLLIAQAIAEDLTLVSKDKALMRYDKVRLLAA